MQRAAGAPSGVADVAEETGGMADRFEVGIWFCAGAHTVEEIFGVGEVIVVATAFLLDQLSFGVEGPPARVADDYVAVVAMNRGAFGLVVQRIGVPDAHFVRQQDARREVIC